MARVHPTALVDAAAALAADAEVGPYAVIGPNVTVGACSRIGPHAILERNVRLGANVRIGPHSVIGGDPQDLKFKGEQTTAEIGDDTVVREFVTINRGTAWSGSTTLGRGCLVMSNAHVGHDCHVGDGVIISNSVGIAGHVAIEERATIGGMTGIHQFVKVGQHAFIGGMSKVSKDVPPFVKADGQPARLFGLNTIGLQRAGFAPDTVEELKKAYRLFFRSSLNISQAVERARSELASLPEVEAFVAFIEASERGVVV